jgi:EAL domain-containing protein (putative c-di-GMP-specific phosphodiesterase class I)
VKALLQLSRELGLETVAEFVQTEAAADCLQAWGCDYLQGALTGLAVSGEHADGSRALAG